MNNYETVFILTPVLSEPQMKEAVDKFIGLLQANGAEIVNHENWGLKKLAYPIQKKSTGFYNLVEFKANPELAFAVMKLFFASSLSVRTSSQLNTLLREEIVSHNQTLKRHGSTNRNPLSYSTCSR